MKLTTVLLAALVATLPAAPAALAADTTPVPAQTSPQPAAKPDDAECVLVGLVLSANKDNDIQKAGEMMAVYYLGRFEGGHGGELEKALRDASVRAQAGMSTIGPACGDAFNARMASLTAIGEQLARPAPTAP